ncbi:MAG TPA: LysM peptidoglycan-binding domain-containing protein [Myxococcota bacterium]|nr:LysM peptidoglycan-binding domain-containing protein [Myxococcota bacterium]HND30276.1 LysM peptidoglycan-binding domain-containing protein [Myxococcota bacterium]HNH46358.1 LysM peptidoglycan-binding domain-containing protein [Myxococcota bacterium]
MSSGGKASFIGIEGSSANFAVQYNPREFSVSKSVTWEEAETQGDSTQPIQYQKGAPMSATMELIFDTTHDGSDVKTTWVNGLLSLTNADEAAVGGEQKKLGKKRPPALCFTWGSFTMNCVIENVDVTYLMFNSNGSAVRAKCTVKLKEWVVASTAGGGGGSSLSQSRVNLTSGSGGSASKVVEVLGGQTLSQVASAHGTTAQAIAAMNNISDPLADLTGTKVAIPGF